MKKIIILFLFAMCFSSCDREDTVSTTQSGIVVSGVTVSEFTHDGCEYLYRHVGSSFGITHKGNCKNPIHKLK